MFYRSEIPLLLIGGENYSQINKNYTYFIFCEQKLKEKIRRKKKSLFSVSDYSLLIVY